RDLDTQHGLIGHGDPARGCSRPGWAVARATMARFRGRPKTDDDRLLNFDASFEIDEHPGRLSWIVGRPGERGLGSAGPMPDWTWGSGPGTGGRLGPVAELDRASVS